MSCPSVLRIAPFCAPLLLLAQLTSAGEGDTSTKADTGKSKPGPVATAGKPGQAAPPGDGHEAPPIQWPGIDLPAYQPPDAYSVDFVIQSPDGEMVMKRSIDKGRMRTELSADGQDIVMIEMGDEKGTMVTLMPKEKRALKTSSALMQGMAPGGTAREPEQSEAAPPADMQVEDLGDETLDGRAVKKLRMSVDGGSALGWFDRTTGAPVRFESTFEGKKTVMDWKNYEVGPQAARLFEVPKDYEVMDMEEMMAQMKGMGGMAGLPGGMAGLPGGMAGMPGGMAGMAGGMAGNMAGGMAQNFGQEMGGSLGASLGGALGGPIGSIAGRYIGGKIGRLIGKKVAGAVVPGQ